MVRQTLLGRLSIAVNANFDRFRQQTRTAGRSTKQLSAELRKARGEARRASAEFRQLRSRLSGLGTIAGSAFAGFGIAEVTRGALAFDRSLTRINTLVGITREEIAEWRQDIVDISRETAISTDQLADGLFNIASIGQRGTEAMETLRTIARATAVGLGDFATVADVITRIVGAWGAEVVNAEQAADALFATIRLGNDRGEEFVRVFQQLSAQASTANVTVDDLGGALAFLTANGFTAQRAAVGLGQVFATIIRPSIRAKDALDAIGLGFRGLQELVLEQGLVNALREVQDRLTAVGLNISQIFRDKDAVVVARALADEYQRALQYAEQVGRLGVGASLAGFQGLQESVAFRFDQAVAELRTNLEEIANRILPEIADNFGVISDVVAFIGSALVTGFVFRGIGAIGTAFNNARKTSGALRKEIDLLGAQADEASTAFAKNFRAAGNLEKGTDAYNKAVSEAGEALGNTIIFTARNIEAQRRLRNTLLLTTGEWLAYGASVAGLTAYFSSLLETTEKERNRREEYNKVLRESLELTEALAQQRELLEFVEGSPIGGGAAVEQLRESIRVTEDLLESRQKQIEAFHRESQILRIYGDEIGETVVAMDRLKRAAEDFQDAVEAGTPQIKFLDSMGIDPQDSVVLERISNNLETLGFRYQDWLFSHLDAIELRNRKESEALRDTQEIISNLIAPLRPSAVDPFILRLQRATEDAQMGLDLRSASADQVERETELLRVRRFVEDELTRVAREQAQAHRAIAEARKADAPDTPKRIGEQEQILDLLAEEEARLKSILVPGSELNKQVEELIELKVRANQEGRDAESIAEREAAAQQLVLDRREAIAAATERARQFSADILQSAEAELRIAELAANLRAGGATDSEVAGEVAKAEARIRIEQRRDDLTRRIAQAEADAAIARAEQDSEALADANLRIEALQLELETTDELGDSVERLGEIRARIHELTQPARTTATEFEMAFDRMGDSVDSFIRDFARGEESFERLVNRMLDHIFELFTVQDTLKGFDGLLNSVFSALGLFSTGSGSASVNFRAPGFRHQGGSASGFTIVGEHGPELVDFQTPSRVYSNSDLAEAVGGTGGVVLNQTNRIESTDGPGTRRAIATAMPEIIRQTVAAVRHELADRGSGLRNSLR